MWNEFFNENLSLTLLHPEWLNFNSFGHSECLRVKFGNEIKAC